MRIPFFDNKMEGSDGEKVRQCEDLLRMARAAREPYETGWLNNALYLAGNQWESAYRDFTSTTRRADIKAPDTGKVKLVSNRLLPLQRQSASSIHENRATQIATPATNDPDDVAAAELSTDVLQGRFYEDNEERKQLNEILWCQVAGSCMRKTYWDPGADGVNARGDKRSGIGDVVTETLNPFQFYVAPWYDSQGETPWVIESSVRDIDEINDMYPGHDVQVEEVASAVGNLDKLLINVVEQRDAQAPKRGHAAILNVLSQKPDHRKGAPRGRTTVWANGKLLAQTELPEGELTMARMQWFPIVGRVYPLPFLSPLIDLQHQINIILCQLVELKNRQLRGDIVVRGSGEPRQEYVKDENGRKTAQKYIRVPAGILDWKFLQYDLNVGEAERLLAQLWNDMREIAGVHEPTSGAQLNRDTTATEIMRLVESDLRGMSLFRSGFDHVNSEISRHKLVVIRNHYVQARMARVVGSSNTVKTPAFFGSDLRNTEDVRPKPAPLVTETMKLQIKQERLAGGFWSLPPEAMLDKANELLNSGMPDAREVLDDLLAPMTLEGLKDYVAKVKVAGMERIIAQIEGEGEEAPPNPPSVSISFRDLNQQGQEQAAALAGIDISGGGEPAAEETDPMAGLMGGIS